MLSLLMHGVLFSVLLWAPGYGSSGLKMNEVVYEVTLEDASKINKVSSPAAQKRSAKAVSSDNRQARRISPSSKQKDTVNISKRTTKRISSKPKKDQVSSNQLLDRAISKIEKGKTEKGTDYIDRTIASIDKKAGSSGAGTGEKGASGGNLAINMYRMKVDALIKSHWSYSDTIGNQKKPEATVLVKISRDGTVLETGFIRPSKNDKFDESVLKAIEKAKPLPALPEGYKGNYGEIEIDFILKDLE